MATSAESGASTELLEVNAEIQRLAKLLGIAADELAYLRDVPSAELRTLRGQVTELLFDGQRVLGKLAAAARLLPPALTANLSEKVFGPMLSARIAGLVDPDRAVEIAAKLPTGFLAEVALELDPRRAATVLGRIPPATVAAVTRRLVARQEWVAMGTFYGYLPDASIGAAMQECDDHALLQIALVLDDKQRLSHVFDLAGPSTVQRLAAAAEAAALSEQLRALGDYLTPDQQAQLPL